MSRIGTLTFGAVLLAWGLPCALQAAPAVLTPPTPLTAWRWMPDASTLPDPASAPEMDTNAPGWQSAAVGDDVFQGRLGYAWFQTILPKSAIPPRRIHFESVDDNAAVYLNGRLLVHHEVWNDPFDAPVGTAWRAKGPNVLTVRVQNTAGGGGISGPVREEFSDPVTLSGGQFAAQLDPSTGGLTSLTNSADLAHMNWVHAGGVWGTGWLRRDGQRAEWQLTAPVRVGPSTVCTAQYQAGAVKIAVRRQVTPQGRLDETYTLTNTGKQPLALAEGDFGIRTPFNDSYTGGAAVCLTGRCNAHVWCGGATAYMCALRMGGTGPHLGLVLTQGSLTAYTVDGAHSSDDRGLISLSPAAMMLAPGQSRTISWTLFWHTGWEDFYAKAAQTPAFVRLDASRYTLPVGEMTTITASGKLRQARVSVDGRAVPARRGSSGQVWDYQPKTVGEHLVRLKTDRGETFLRVFATPAPMTLIQSRVLFIVRHQQRLAPGTPLDGAYLIYDNRTGQQVYETVADHNAGRERVGMGCLVARFLLTRPDPAVAAEVRASLDRYYAYVNRELTDDSGVVYGDVGRQDAGRLYNYPWVAELHLLMYQVTQDLTCLHRFVRTIQSLYSRGGTGFYCIGLPIREGLTQLQQAGMTSDYEALKGDFTRHADTLAANGINIPSFEVSYEQSIVSPAVQILLETYLVTHQEKYLTSARTLLPLMNAFNGRQPDYHLNDVAIRHWDDYWFGKSRQYGDTFPHYWTTITAVAMHDLAQATNDAAAQTRAEKIVANNLCLFRPDGSASCAYVYPLTIDGHPGRFFDAWANDQDWALDNYLIVMAQSPRSAP